MNIKITETGERKELSITDWRTGLDWTNDLIGNAGAMSDGQFSWSEEDNAYLASQDTFDWWAKYIADSEATDAEVSALADKLNVDHWIIRERIYQHISADGDYEMHRNHAVQAMKEIEEEYA